MSFAASFVCSDSRSEYEKSKLYSFSSISGSDGKDTVKLIPIIATITATITAGIKTLALHDFIKLLFQDKVLQF